MRDFFEKYFLLKNEIIITKETYSTRLEFISLILGILLGLVYLMLGNILMLVDSGLIFLYFTTLLWMYPISILSSKRLLDHYPNLIIRKTFVVVIVYVLMATSLLFPVFWLFFLLELFFLRRLSSKRISIDGLKVNELKDE